MRSFERVHERSSGEARIRDWKKRDHKQEGYAKAAVTTDQPTNRAARENFGLAVRYSMNNKNTSAGIRPTQKLRESAKRTIATIIAPSPTSQRFFSFVSVESQDEPSENCREHLRLNEDAIHAAPDVRDFGNAQVAQEDIDGCQKRHPEVREDVENRKRHRGSPDRAPAARIWKRSWRCLCVHVTERIGRR